MCRYDCFGNYDAIRPRPILCAMNQRTITIGLVFLALFTGRLCALETIRFTTKEGTETESTGRILLLGPQGEFLLQARDGQLFEIQPDSIISHESDKTLFVPWTPPEFEDALRDEFGPDFHVLATDHYWIVYNTSERYAKWIGDSFDRFYKTYHSVWTKFGLDLAEPEFPLVAILFSDKKQFDQQVRKEVGNAMPLEMRAYYHKWTNRIVLCDLSGIEKQLEEMNNAARRGVRVNSSTILNRPGTGHNLSAMFHEAAHQIGCNTGMFPRLAPIPLWLLEGVAMLHEIPDVNHPRRQESGVPGVNKVRLEQFRVFSRKSPNDPVRIMLQTDTVLRSSHTAQDYYGLSWGFTYFLYKQKPKEFATYLREMAAKTAADADSPTLRLLDFENHFGQNWNKLQRDFVRYAQSLR